MKEIINRVNRIIDNRYTNSAEKIARRLYPRPYFLEKENGGDDEPVLYI